MLGATPAREGGHPSEHVKIGASDRGIQFKVLDRLNSCQATECMLRGMNLLQPAPPPPPPPPHPADGVGCWGF